MFANGKAVPSFTAFEAGVKLGLPEALRRTSAYLSHPVFSTHHSETEMLRYLRALADKDLALDRTMIPLGSCTMKLNATSEMIPITWPEFAHIHPSRPCSTEGLRPAQKSNCAPGCRKPPATLASVCNPMPAPGRIRGPADHQGLSRSQGPRPPRHLPDPRIGPRHQPSLGPNGRHESGRHKCDADGNVDLDDLKAKCELHSANLAAVMITYPSTACSKPA